MSLTKELVLRGLLRARKRQSFDPRRICHPKQYRLVSDKSRSVVVVAGRRSGKSFAAVVKMCALALSSAGISCLYISATRPSAKKMAWAPLLRMNRDYELGGVPNYSELSMVFANGSTVYVLGIDSEKAADRARGIERLALAIVDEAQRYRKELLDYLLRDVLRPGTLDAGITGPRAIWVMGTPNPLGKIGTLWERVNSPQNSVHTFTVYDNTKLGTKAQIEAAIQEDLKDENQTKESAWFRREYLAKWDIDLAFRVYHFDEERDVYNTLPDDLTHFIVAADIGMTAADAVLVGGWSDDDPTVYLVEEHVKTGQTVTALGEVLKRIYDKYDPIKIAVDPGANGTKVIATVKEWFPDIPIEAALKPAINIQVKALNDRLDAGRLKVPAASVFSAEVRRASWVDGVVNGKIHEEGGHSDAVPTMRYLVIAARPFLPDEPELSPEERARLAKEAERAERMEKSRKQNGISAPGEEDGESWGDASAWGEADTWEDEALA